MRIKNDQFTVTEGTTIGNGALTNPVGLLTADAASMAGLIYNGTEDVINPNYLYTNQYWWSLTPRYMMSFGNFICV